LRASGIGPEARGGRSLKKVQVQGLHRSG